MNIPVNHVSWKQCWRIIPTHYPVKDVFDRIAPPEDIDAIRQVEQMTSNRSRQAAGEISFVSPGDEVTGPGSQYIMAAFAYTNLVEGSRFSDGTFGVYYAAKTLATAVAETAYHCEQFMRRTNEEPAMLGRRVLVASVSGKLHDIRGMQKHLHLVYSRTSYAASRDLGIKLRNSGSYGIAFDSVRHTGGEAVAVFRPPVLSLCREERHLIYEWNGKKVSKVHQLHELPRP